MRISDWSSDVCSSDLINLPYGCRLGTCCSCRGKVISGSVDFGNAHPAYLPQSQRDQGYALLCSATPLSDLTIEIDELPPLSDTLAFPAMVKAMELMAPDEIGGASCRERVWLYV